MGFFVILCLLHRLARFFWPACPVSTGCEDNRMIAGDDVKRRLIQFRIQNSEFRI